MKIRRAFRHSACLTAIALVTAGCHQGMWNKSRFKPMEPSSFFEDGSSSRPFPEGVVQFASPRVDSHLYEGKVNGQFATTYPFEITMDVLKRGQERYEIYCTPCHGHTGDGNGMIVQRELKKAASHTQDPRLLDPELSPPGYFFDVITNGFGVMYSYATRITPEDRWAVVAYIKALQLSQNVSFADLSMDEQQQVLQPAGDESHATEEQH